jgi:hypothetical protein
MMTHKKPVTFRHHRKEGGSLRLKQLSLYKYIDIVHTWNHTFEVYIFIYHGKDKFFALPVYARGVLFQSNSVLVS